MIALSLLIFIKKDFLSLKIIPIVILTLLVSLVLINEDKAPDSILKLRTKIKNLVKKKYKIILEEEPTII